jgi:hypothetical protein
MKSGASKDKLTKQRTNNNTTLCQRPQQSRRHGRLQAQPRHHTPHARSHQRRRQPARNTNNRRPSDARKTHLPHPRMLILLAPMLSSLITGHVMRALSQALRDSDFDLSEDVQG